MYYYSDVSAPLSMILFLLGISVIVPVFVCLCWAKFSPLDLHNSISSSVFLVVAGRSPVPFIYEETILPLVVFN